MLSTVSQIEGIPRTNAPTTGGSILDVAAIVALIGVTVVELIVIAAGSSIANPPERDVRSVASRANRSNESTQPPREQT